MTADRMRRVDEAMREVLSAAASASAGEPAAKATASVERCHVS